jgi:predicted DNA-binding transcriptional regulator YafY
MNRVDRLFAILLLLQRKRHVRALDMARAFEVSERTIYRDMEALCESGVPVLGTPGEGYELMQGYFLPPLLFTPAEATALFLGARMMIAFTKGKVCADAEQALNKIAVILPESMRTELQRLSEIIGFYPIGARFDIYETHLATLQQAIREKRLVHLKYHSYSQDETTERDFEPGRLFYMNGQWYVDGYCRLRRDWRGFRLNRIDELRLLADHFEPRQPAKFEPGQPIVVRIRMASRIVRWVHERQYYSIQSEEPVPGSDDLIMTYFVDKFNDILPWLLSWGSAATVLEPPQLREVLCHELTLMLDQLSESQ